MKIRQVIKVNQFKNINDITLSSNPNSNIKYLGKLCIKIIRNYITTKDALFKHAETVWQEMRGRLSLGIESRLNNSGHPK